MTSYILLALLITIIAIGIVRASKQPKVNRRRRPQQARKSEESTLTALSVDEDSYEDEEDDDDNEEEEPEEEDEDEDLFEEEEQELELEQEETEQPIHEPTKPIKNELITITLRAEENKPYKGYELLQALLTCGMRYSRQGIFHRYTKLIKRDEVLFSLISAVAPGTFDLPKMGNFSSPALTLFMQTGDVDHPGETYDLMLTTARDLVEALGGYLLDETKAPLTAEKVSYWQHRLKSAVTV